MSFISYAQNFEDVMLWRALKHIDRGFYIDIGAQDPIIDSVSLAFYQHGWRGVHIEPTQQYSSKLRNARQDEVVEQVAIGNSQGTLKFYEFCDTGLSTADPTLAKRHEDAGFFAKISEIRVATLASILERYSEQSIQWLKIDVEGWERSVIESWGTCPARPWILVIESTSPLTQNENHSKWEDLIIDKGYIFAYFDGLNRFYVHQEHRALIKSFALPPNIFDGFLLSGTASHSFYQLASSKAQEADLRAREAEGRTRAIEVETREIKMKEREAKVRAREIEVEVQEAKVNAREAEVRAREAEAKVQAVEMKMHEAEMKAQAAESRAQETESKTWQAVTTAQQTEAALNHALAQLGAMHASASWRITAPMRFAAGLFIHPHTTLRKGANGLIRWIVEAFQHPLSRAMAAALKRPQIAYRISQFLTNYPALRQQLLSVAQRQGVVPSLANHRPALASNPKIDPKLEHLTQHARQVYADLKAAIEHKRIY